MRMKLLLLPLAVTVVLIFLLVFAQIGGDPTYSVTPAPADVGTSSITPTAPTITPQFAGYRTVVQDVPFIVQAPRHNWGDILYQNACEEATVLMAMRWVYDMPLTSEEAFVEIKKLSDYSQRKYGFHLDQSAEDVARLMRDYFNYKKIEHKGDIGVRDIKEELMKGNIVLVPVNGRKLGNPFFTAPGPIQHMLVVRGYDAMKKEFITNDPGVGKGNGYRYGESVLEGALQAYPTGYHEEISGIKKTMIVVGKD